MLTLILILVTLYLLARLYKPVKIFLLGLFVLVVNYGFWPIFLVLFYLVEVKKQ
jgi:hypothetical protein